MDCINFFILVIHTTLEQAVFNSSLRFTPCRNALPPDSSLLGFKRILNAGVDTFVSLVSERSQTEYMRETIRFYECMIATLQQQMSTAPTPLSKHHRRASSMQGFVAPFIVNTLSASDHPSSAPIKQGRQLMFLSFPIKDQQPAPDTTKFREFLDELLNLVVAEGLLHAVYFSCLTCSCWLALSSTVLHLSPFLSARFYI